MKMVMNTEVGHTKGSYVSVSEVGVTLILESLVMWTRMSEV